MSVEISARFAFEVEHKASALLQFEAADLPEQELVRADTRLTPTKHFARVPAQDNIGERIWIEADGLVEVEYEAQVTAHRLVAELAALDALPPHKLPGPAVKFLLDSRYCHSSQFIDFADAQFGGTRGGARIAAINDWIAGHMRYTPGASGSATTATDTFHSGLGICRDYAHLFVTLARASAIPARYVACYAPGVTPQDFHAVAEVFLANPEGAGGLWQLVDATGMADLHQAVTIGVGRDAADVSFLTSFAPMRFLSSEVSVTVSR